MIDSKEYSKDGAEFHLSGLIASKEIIELNTELINQWDFADYKYQLWVFEDVEDFQLNPLIIRRLAFQDRDASEKNPNMQVAFVSISPLVFGLCRMYESFYSNGPWETRVFRSLSEAREWLKK